MANKRNGAINTESEKHTKQHGLLSLRPGTVRIAKTACCGGKNEKEGPYGGCLDLYMDTDDLGYDSFEKAESEMVRRTVGLLLEKAHLKDSDVDLLLAGDLMNQCTATAYGLSGFDIPYMGLYGACSTFAEGLLCASALIDGELIDCAVVAASSHFCTAERQFRYPLGYGAVISPTAQNTVTGCGAVLLTRAGDEDGVSIGGGLFGIVGDSGIRDASNMGAAMATAAADTLSRYFDASGETFGDFDRVATGDLGAVGLDILRDLLYERGYDAGRKLTDCGVMIYDTETQEVGCGGSGCGCSAVMTAGYFFDALQKKELRRVAIAGTGALMSPQSILQKQSIPAVCHMVVLES